MAPARSCRRVLRLGLGEEFFTLRPEPLDSRFQSGVQRRARKARQQPSELGYRQALGFRSNVARRIEFDPLEVVTDLFTDQRGEMANAMLLPGADVDQFVVHSRRQLRGRRD